jgi:hypothetical protein
MGARGQEMRLGVEAFPRDEDVFRAPVDLQTGPIGVLFARS